MNADALSVLLVLDRRSYFGPVPPEVRVLGGVQVHLLARDRVTSVVLPKTQRAERLITGEDLQGPVLPLLNARRGRPAPQVEVFDGLSVNPRLHRLLDPATGESAIAALILHVDPETGDAAVYAKSAENAHGVLYALVALLPLQADLTVADVCRQVLRGGALVHEVKAHTGRFVVHHPGVDIERKLNLPGQVDIVALAQQFHQHVSTHAGPFRPEFNDEIQFYERHVDIYEVFRGQERAGFVTFTRHPQGRVRVRSKLFTPDPHKKMEAVLGWYEPHVETPLDFLGRTLPALRAEYAGPFVRVKVDLNVEDLATGHIFSLGFDQTDTGHGAHHQVEVEYVRTRNTAAAQAHTLDRALSRLVDFSRSWCQQQGVPAADTTLTKGDMVLNARAEAAHA